MTKNRIVAVVGDMHANSTVALCPPRFTLDDGGQYVASEHQRWIWRHWLAYWKEVAEVKERTGYPLYAIFNGELADDLNHRSTQLITKNNTDQIRLAYTVLKPALDVADHVIVTRGTEAHSKASSSLDEKIAEDISAIPDPYGRYAWNNFTGDIGGVRFDIAHHPGHGHGRPWTRGGDANRLAADIVFRYAEVPARQPDIVIRSHVHKPVDSFDNFQVRAIILPSWQLNNAFGFKLGGGWLPIGGLYIICRDGDYEVVKRYKRWNVKKEIWSEKSLPKAT
jgi:hypothetical protein